jgi:hypothetical protein
MRPLGKSPERWLNGFAHWTPDERALLVEFARRVDASVFGPAETLATTDVAPLCQRVASLCTRSRLSIIACPEAPVAPTSIPSKPLAVPPQPTGSVVSLQLQFHPPGTRTMPSP